MADYREARQIPPTFSPAGRASPPYNQTNTTVNVPTRSTSMVMPVLVAVGVVAIAGVIAWRVLDGDATVAPAPVTQTTVPETTAPTTPPAVPDGDPAPATPPVGDPPANPPATPPTAVPNN